MTFQNTMCIHFKAPLVVRSEISLTLTRVIVPMNACSWTSWKVNCALKTRHISDSCTGK